MHKIVRAWNALICYVKFGPAEARWYLDQCKAYRAKRGIK